MVVPEVEIGVRHAQALVVLELAGEITRHAEAELMGAYQLATERQPTALLVDFTAVDYINSTGIALIVGLVTRARKEGRELSAYGLTEHYTEIFAVTRLTEFITIYPSEQAAVCGARGRLARREQGR